MPVSSNSNSGPPLSPAIFFDQLPVRKFPLRVFVQHPHVAVRGGVVEVEPVFFRVLTVVAFIAGEPEHALFQKRIAAVPKGEGEHQQLIAIADSGNAVLTPAINSAARLIVGEGIPRIAIGAIVLTHAAPAPVADIGPPFAPGRLRADIGFG